MYASSRLFNYPYLYSTEVREYRYRRIEKKKQNFVVLDDEACKETAGGIISGSFGGALRTSG